MSARPILGAVLGGALLLGGCGKSGISGAAMMRVEVEVYKGPVGQSTDIQIGELSALLAESARATHDWIRGARALQTDTGRSGPGCAPVGTGADPARWYADRPSCGTLERSIEGAVETVAMICDLNAYWIDKATITGAVKPEPDLDDVCDAYRYGRSREIKSQVPADKRAAPAGYKFVGNQLVLAATRFGAEPQTTNIADHIAEYARRIAIITSTMRTKAFRLSNDGIHYIPDNRNVRSVTANYAFLTAEFANQLAARISAVQKIIEDKDLPNRRKTLPIGDYLRDVAPTAALDNFRSYNAGAAREPIGTLPLRDRVRAVQGQVNDYYWEKINEVYASGQGDVSMAFVKDDLGNWNLKSFDNDPSDLLAAYRKGANALIKAAVDVAKKTVPVVGGATAGFEALTRGERLLDMAERMSSGSGSEGAVADSGVADTLTTRAANRLTAAKGNFAARASELTTKLTTLDAELPLLEAAAVTEKGKSDATGTAYETAKTTLATCYAMTPSPACQTAFDAKRVEHETATAATAKAVAAVEAKKVEIAVNKATTERLPAEAAAQAQLILQDAQENLTTLDTALTPPAASVPATPALPTPPAL